MHPVLIPVCLGDLIANKGSGTESLSLGSPASSGWGQSLDKQGDEKDPEATRVAVGGCFKQGSGGNMRRKAAVKKEQTLQEAYGEEVTKSKVLGQLPFKVFAEGKAAPGQQ